MGLPGAIAAGATIISGLSSLFGGGGGDRVDPELVQLQKDIGKALLNQFNFQQKIDNPFRADLSQVLRKRTGKTLPVKTVDTSAAGSPLESISKLLLANRPGNVTGGPDSTPTVGRDGMAGSDRLLTIPKGSFLSSKSSRQKR